MALDTDKSHVDVPCKLFIKWLSSGEGMGVASTRERKVWLQGFIVKADGYFVIDDGTSCVSVAMKEQDARVLSNPIGKYIMITGVYKAQNRRVECRQVVDLSHCPNQ